MANAPTEQVGSQLLFENERVRVWELAVEPGESLETHIHREDYLYIVSSGGTLRFADPDNPADARDVQFEDNQVAFVTVPDEGKVDNRLTNVGNKPHRNYVIELKTS
jgi:beta-alanine degradation protein BauB